MPPCRGQQAAAEATAQRSRRTRLARGAGRTARLEAELQRVLARSSGWPASRRGSRSRCGARLVASRAVFGDRGAVARRAEVKASPGKPSSRRAPLAAASANPEARDRGPHLAQAGRAANTQFPPILDQVTARKGYETALGAALSEDLEARPTWPPPRIGAGRAARRRPARTACQRFRVRRGATGPASPPRSDRVVDKRGAGAAGHCGRGRYWSPARATSALGRLHRGGGCAVGGQRAASRAQPPGRLEAAGAEARDRLATLRTEASGWRRRSGSRQRRDARHRGDERGAPGFRHGTRELSQAERRSAALAGTIAPQRGKRRLEGGRGGRRRRAGEAQAALDACRHRVA